MNTNNMKLVKCVVSGQDIWINKYASEKTAKSVEYGGKGIPLGKELEYGLEISAEPEFSQQSTPPRVKESMRESRDAKIQKARPMNPKPKALRQSMINLYLQCPAKFYDTYENGYEESNIFTRVGTAIHGIMEDYYKDPDNANVEELFDKWWVKHAIPDWDWYTEWRELVKAYFEKHATKEKPNIIALELEFNTEVNGVPISGTIDRIDRIDDKTICIIDYKTNFRPWSQNELAQSIQASFYMVAAEQLKDKLGDFENIEWQYEMLRLGLSQRTSRTREELEKFKSWIKVIWEKMLSGVDREPKLNQYCGHCNKRFSCPLYNDILQSNYSPVVTGNTTIEKLHNEREQLMNIKKIIELRLDEIDQQIATLIQENGGAVQIDDEHEYVLVSQAMYTYDPAGVVRTLTLRGLSDRLPEVISISKTKLEWLAKGDKALQEELNKWLQKNYKKPTLTKRKIKK